MLPPGGLWSAMHRPYAGHVLREIAILILILMYKVDKTDVEKNDT